jgi:CBS domain-containing protein
MRCEDLMKKTLVCIEPSGSAREAADLMRTHNVGIVVVCDAEHRAVGVVTDRDIVTRVVAPGLPASTAVKACMTREVVACRASDELRVAERLMTAHRVGRVVCLDARGKAVGVVSLSDVAEIENRGRASQVMRDIAARETGLRQPNGHDVAGRKGRVTNVPPLRGPASSTASRRAAGRSGQRSRSPSR